MQSYALLEGPDFKLPQNILPNIKEMPIQWGTAKVRNFKYNALPTKVARTLSYKTNIINGKNARGRAPILQNNNTRRKTLYNPNLNPQAAYVAIATGVNVPRNYSQRLSPENAFQNATKAHANWLRNNKPEATRNENMWNTNTNSPRNKPEATRNENMWNKNSPLTLVSLPRTDIKRKTWNQRSRKVRNRNTSGALKVVRNPYYTIKSRSS